MKVRKYAAMAVVLAVLFLLFTGEAKAQTVGPEQSDSILRVVPLYDTNHDGQWEGVGAGVVVSVRESGSSQSFFNVTNEVSEASFLVAKRTYIVQAYPEQSRLFFRWVCSGQVLVETSERVFILYCYEMFFLNLPWASN